MVRDSSDSFLLPLVATFLKLLAGEFIDLADLKSS